jgi:hypothetical protein
MKNDSKKVIDPEVKGKKIKSPFDFEAPPYDERSSVFINAGTHQGLGKTQPVGHIGNAKETCRCLPQKSKTILKNNGDMRNIQMDIQD